MKHLITILLLGSALSVSAQMRLGEKNPLQPPFCETFDDYRSGLEREDFDRYFQVIDANNDGRTWGFYNYSDDQYSKCAYLLYPIDVARADDWLIPRAIRLEAGKHYCVTMDASLYLDGSTHLVEVKYGLYNDAEGLDTEVIPATAISTRKGKYLEGWICPEFDTNYYLGIHAISTDKTGYLFVDNIAIAQGLEGTAPDKVTDVKLANDPAGSGRLDIAFTAPAKDLDGKALNGNLSTIVVKRGDMVIKTFTDVAPGTALTVADATADEGDFIYTITASNVSGLGATSRHEMHKGLGAPLPPVITSFVETRPGTAVITWEAPTEDVYGNPIDPAAQTFSVYEATEFGPNILFGYISEREFEIEIDVARGEQMLYMALVTATIGERESDYAVSDYLCTGTPYTLPYHNSYTVDDYYNHIMEVSSDYDDITWRMLDDHSEPSSQDADNGFVCMIGSTPKHTGTMRTGKIDLTGATNPALNFYTYVYNNDSNDIIVSIMDCATGESTDLPTIHLFTFDRMGWTPIFLPLQEWAGKVVRIAITGKIMTHGYLPIDNFRVEEMPLVDLAITAVDLPRYADVDTPFTVTAHIANNGAGASPAAKAVLLVDGEEVAEADVPALEIGAATEVSLSHTLSAVSSANPTVQVRVNAEGEGRPEDNVSELTYISFIAPIHPTVNDLTLTDNVLTWSAPDLSKAAPEQTVKEDFESYECFATNLPSWGMKDADGGYVGGFNTVSMPVDRTQQAFWVMDDAAPYDFFDFHSGHKGLVQMYSLDAEGRGAVACDDWIISPKLYGGRQTISFWASSLTVDYGAEHFEVYSSADGENFELVVADQMVPEEWTEYRVNLPDGANYFAVRCTSKDNYMLLLDDFEFYTAGTPRPLTLMGYNVYRNHELLNAAPITDTTYQVAKQEGDKYYVTALYAQGESMASNVVEYSSITETESGCERSEQIYDLQGRRVNNPTRGLYIINGRKAIK